MALSSISVAIPSIGMAGKIAHHCSRSRRKAYRNKSPAAPKSTPHKNPEPSVCVTPSVCRKNRSPKPISRTPPTTLASIVRMMPLLQSCRRRGTAPELICRKLAPRPAIDSRDLDRGRPYLDREVHLVGGCGIVLRLEQPIPPGESAAGDLALP